MFFWSLGLGFIIGMFLGLIRMNWFLVRLVSGLVGVMIPLRAQLA